MQLVQLLNDGQYSIHSIWGTGRTGHLVNYGTHNILVKTILGTNNECSSCFRVSLVLFNSYLYKLNNYVYSVT